MKKLSLLLALMLSLCSFTACGDSDDSEEKDSSSVSQKDKGDEDEDDDDDEKDSSSDSKKKKNDEKKSSTDSEKDKDDEEKDKDDDDKKSMEFSRGKVENNVYTNEFSGLTIETPEGWSVYSDEEIKQTMGIGLEAGGSKLDADKLAESAVVDFAAVNVGTGESIAITYENAAKFPENYMIDNYIAAFKMSTKASMPNADIEWDEDTDKVELSGIEFDTFGSDIEIEAYGLNISQEYYIAEVDGYMISIAYTSGYSSGTMEDYYDCFKD